MPMSGISFHTMATLEIVRFSPGINYVFKTSLSYPYIFSPGGEINFGSWLSARSKQSSAPVVFLAAGKKPICFGSCAVAGVSVESGSIRFGSHVFTM